MQITTAALLTTLVAAPMAVMADSCDDGASCKYWDEVSWTNAAEKFCDPSDNRIVQRGDTFVAKTSKNDDGAGGAQIFSGTYEVSGQKDYTIHDQECASYMSQIYAKCGGYGGSIDTGFGTVTAECIVDDSAQKPEKEVVGGDEDEDLDAAPKLSFPFGDRRRRDLVANRAKKLQDSQARAELKQHKEDEEAKQKQEEEAKIHEEHQKVAEDEDAKVQGTAMKRDDGEDVPEDRAAEEERIHEEHAKVAADEDAKAAENQKIAAEAAEATTINSRDDTNVEEEDKIHAAHSQVAADEDMKITAGLAQQASKFIQIFRRQDDLKNEEKVDTDQAHESQSTDTANAKTQEDKTAEEAKIKAEQDKVATDEKAKEDQKAAELKKQADDKAAEDAKIESQTVQ